eukprot:scaffold32519_cov27-Tisochrysis_lutea.AAC.3
MPAECSMPAGPARYCQTALSCAPVRSAPPMSQSEPARAVSVAPPRAGGVDRWPSSLAVVSTRTHSMLRRAVLAFVGAATNASADLAACAALDAASAALHFWRRRAAEVLEVSVLSLAEAIVLQSASSAGPEKGSMRSASAKWPAATACSPSFSHAAPSRKCAFGSCGASETIIAASARAAAALPNASCVAERLPKMGTGGGRVQEEQMQATSLSRRNFDANMHQVKALKQVGKRKGRAGRQDRPHADHPSLSLPFRGSIQTSWRVVRGE